MKSYNHICQSLIITEHSSHVRLTFIKRDIDANSTQQSSFRESPLEIYFTYMYISHSIIHQKNPYIIQLYVPFCLLRPLKKAVPHLLSGTSKKKNLLEWKKKKISGKNMYIFFFLIK